MMTRKSVRNLMMLSLEKAIELYLTTLETEGKSPRYIDWLQTRLRFFSEYMHQVHGEAFKLQDLEVEDGREYIRHLMGRESRYANHPMHKTQKGKLKIQYIHGLGRAVRSFSSWAYEEGYLDENVMRRLKLPQLPKTFPEPLSEEEIQKVLSASLDDTRERLRNFSIMMLFLDTGIRLDELVNLRLSRIDFAVGEMTIFGKGSKERKVPVGSQAKRAMIDYLAKERPEPVNPQDEDRLYLSADGYPITHDAVEKLFQRVKKKAEVTKLHPHACRHTFSVRYLVNGGDAFSLQKILGHTSLEMTRKYVNLASGDVKVVVFGPKSTTATEVAAGARLAVDVEFGRGRTLFALSQGVWDGPFEGTPALPNTGALMRVNPDGTFTEILDGLNQPTSVEIIKNTAYVVTLTGEVWKIDNISAPPYGD